MHSIITLLESILTNIVEVCTIILELFGVAILVSTAVKCFWYGQRSPAYCHCPRMGRTWHPWRDHFAARHSHLPDTLGNQTRGEGAGARCQEKILVQNPNPILPI